MTNKARMLLKSILISLCAGLAGSLLSPEMRVIYETANKPAFALPGYVFGVVWILLYTLMGIAAYRIYLHGKEKQEVREALFYYGVQLFLIFLWPVLFFRFALAGTALIDIILLVALIAVTTVKFCKIDKTAGLLMLPYLIWLIYTGILNYTFLQ